MSDLEYEIWRGCVQQRCGLYFTDSRKRILRQRLWERMRLLGIRSYSEFYHYVNFNPAGEREWEEVQESLLNLETRFFRHPPSFKALTDYILPDLMSARQKRGVNAITMWSAGCSTGPEAYSLAMAFLEFVAPASALRDGEAVPLIPGGWQLIVSGTDISRLSLEKARRGRFKPHEVRFMPDQYREKYLERIEGEEGAFYQVDERLHALVRFGVLDLNDPQGYWITAQDVIFCQNVLLYFENQSRVGVVQRLSDSLSPGGYLVLEPAEVVGLRLPGVQRVRLEDALVYQRVP
jgi:chemotaxis methyl-accepting protein methylase